MVWVLEISNLISHQNHSDPAHLGLHDVGVLPHMDLMLVAHDACPGLNFGFASAKNLAACMTFAKLVDHPPVGPATRYFDV